MKHGLWVGALLGLLTGLLIAFGALPLHAQVSANYDLSWNTSDNGGVLYSSGGRYQVSGTLGQADANEPSSSGNYTLNAGWWNGSALTYPAVYLPVVLRSS